MKNGIFNDLPRAEYDLLLDRVNYSTLKILGQKSPLHYKHALESRPQNIDELEAEIDATKGRRDTLLRGEATHVAALEPGLYDARFTVFEGTRDARHNAFKAVLAAASIARQKIITPDIHRVATQIAKSVRSSPEAAPYIVGGTRESTVCWDYEEPQVGALDGWTIAMRCRLDYQTDAAIIDLKSTVDASPEAFAKQMWNLGAFSQAAMQQDGVAAITRRVRPYFWLAVEVEPPYACALYEPSHIGLDLGRSSYRDWLRKLHFCQETGEWPGYTGGGVMQLDPPRWALPRDQVFE